MEGGYTMRAFYTDASGATANLCQLFSREETRLVIYDADGHQTVRRYFPTWADALSAMRENGHGWTNDLTGSHLD